MLKVFKNYRLGVGSPSGVGATMSRFAMRPLTFAMFGVATVAVPLLTHSLAGGASAALDNRAGIGFVC
jgi:hypothetical protein